MSHELTDWNIEAGATAGRVPASTPILAVDRLCKRYGGTVAVDGISFSVAHNEIVGLVGPNGAGKTTTINMVLGVLEPTSGSIRIGGADIATRRSQALQHTNFAAVYAPLPGNLTVYQNLRIFGLIYGMHDLRARIDTLLRQFDLMRFRDAKCAAQGDTGILRTSHNMYEVQEVCHRVLFLSRGRILREGNPKTLPQEHGKETLEVLFIDVAREPLTLGMS